jgi:hypothetical protein
LRRTYGWETTYAAAGFSAEVKMVHSINAATGEVRVELDTSALTGLGVTETIVMNEQGAHHFDRYWDSSGLCLSGPKIGMWDEVTAHEAFFGGAGHDISFSLCQAKGAKLYRGRECIGSRLAWSGFGCSFGPEAGRFTYTISIRKAS